MPINSMTAVVRANASILEIQAAISVSNAENLYAHATGYCLALLDCEIIDDAQCIRPAKSPTQPCKAKTWCALKFKWAPVIAF